MAHTAEKQIIHEKNKSIDKSGLVRDVLYVLGMSGTADLHLLLFFLELFEEHNNCGSMLLLFGYSRVSCSDHVSKYSCLVGEKLKTVSHGCLLQFVRYWPFGEESNL